MLIIDKISFFARVNFEKIDRNLTNIMGRQDLHYGGVSIVFLGDFHQLRPVCCESHGILYEGIKNDLSEGRINCAIILETSHQFDKDPVFGALPKCLLKKELTEEDIVTLNA